MRRRRVACPGKGEDDADFDYAGSVTSLVALKQAKYVREDNPDVLLQWGTEMSICGDAVKLKGDHAARESRDP